MQKNSTFLFVFLALLLLLPTSFGRVLLDLAGGLMLVSLLIPLLLTGLGWIGWKIVQSKMQTCQSCGTSLLFNSGQCPVCGCSISNDLKNIENSSEPASSATIDIIAEDVETKE